MDLDVDAIPKLFLSFSYRFLKLHPAGDRCSLNPIQFYPVIILARGRLMGMHDKTTHPDIQ
jgi:hypothetical protein